MRITYVKPKDNSSIPQYNSFIMFNLSLTLRIAYVEIDKIFNTQKIKTPVNNKESLLIVKTTKVNEKINKGGTHGKQLNNIFNIKTKKNKN